MIQMEEENFYKDLDPILIEINDKFIKMEKEMKQKSVKLTLDVVSWVIEKMEEKDSVFSAIYSRLEYVGSYFDGLRVKEATEFDFNLIMKLPLDYNKILVENLNVRAGFVTINISKAKNYNQQPETVKRTIEKWCDSSGYLLENKVREWMESVLYRTFDGGREIIYLTDGVRVRLKKSGPAFTLVINTPEVTVDVDLVFTIEFPATKKPPGTFRWTDDLAAAWVLVPKPSENIRFWRISFSNSERKLIHKLYKLKFINRMLKAFRDAQTNIPIRSYFIKTLFLWEAHDCNYSNNLKLWEKRQSYLFVYMLNKLYEHLNSKKLPYYWHKKMDLFELLTAKHMENMANQIKRIIRKIHDLIRAKDVMALRTYVLDLFSKNQNISTCTQGDAIDSSSYSCTIS